VSYRFLWVLTTPAKLSDRSSMDVTKFGGISKCCSLLSGKRDSLSTLYLPSKEVPSMMRGMSDGEYYVSK
jgi:hypothetical protein